MPLVSEHQLHFLHIENRVFCNIFDVFSFRRGFGVLGMKSEANGGWHAVFGLFFPLLALRGGYRLLRRGAIMWAVGMSFEAPYSYHSPRYTG